VAPRNDLPPAQSADDPRLFLTGPAKKVSSRMEAGPAHKKLASARRIGFDVASDLGDDHEPFGKIGG
jgi:hypothetical protein